MKNLAKILTVLAVLTMCSCGKNNENSRTMYSLADEEIIVTPSSPPQELSDVEIETVDRKIIKEGEITFETTDINKTKSLIIQAVQELNGYIEFESCGDNSAPSYYYSSDNNLYCRLDIRIPAEKFDLLLSKISEQVDKFDEKRVKILDVTEEYIDIETRIKTKKELQNKYVQLLKQATKVDEILNIEKELGNLQTEIESVERRMKHLKNRIAFSTLEVSFYQKQEKSYVFNFSSKFVDGVKSGWSYFLQFIVILARLWVFILIGVAIYFVIRHLRKKKTENK